MSSGRASLEQPPSPGGGRDTGGSLKPAVVNCGNSLSGLSPLELEELAQGLGQERFRGRQLFEEIHRKHRCNVYDMKVLPSAFRKALAEQGWRVHGLEIAAVRESSDGTKKLAFRCLADGLIIESVLIPMDNGVFTQCLSSQVGCPLRCTFCMTGMVGFARNLTPCEIVDQYLLARASFPTFQVRNLVFMGMGEPLLNFDNVVAAIRLLQNQRGCALSPRRITVSTAGIAPAIPTLGKEVDCLLAVSLNAPDQKLRSRLMPISLRYPLDELMEAITRFPLKPRRRITFEYVLVDSVNDSPAHARALVRLLSHVRCKVNLIPLNPFPGATLQPPSDAAVNAFLKVLVSKNLTATVRKSKGADIGAACGQLAGSLPQSLPA